MSFAGHDPATLALFALVVLLAAVVRGYSGFGSSALIVSGMSLVVPVSAVVPVVLALEVAASVQMAPRVIRHLDRRLLMLLCAGGALAIPAGQVLLLGLDPRHARIAVSLMVLALVAVMASGIDLERLRGSAFHLVTGALAGCVNGLVAMGGLVASAMLLAGGLPVASVRATLVMLLFLFGGYSVASGLVNGLVNLDTLAVSLLMTPPLYLGVRLGNRLFDPAHAVMYRRLTLGLLALLATIGLVVSVVRG